MCNALGLSLALKNFKQNKLYTLQKKAEEVLRAGAESLETPSWRHLKKIPLGEHVLTELHSLGISEPRVHV